VDTGFFENLENGDTLERGTMRDFDDGKVKAYQEVWRDEVVGDTECVVLELDDTADGLRAVGVVVRLGDWCQGILRNGESVTVERWDQRRLVFRHGEGQLPCGLTYDSNREKSIFLDGQEWSPPDAKPSREDTHSNMPQPNPGHRPV